MADVQPIKLSVKDLTRAIIDKANPASPYSKLSYWVETEYDYGGIFRQARNVFPEYNKLYPTDEEFSKYFARDYFKKDPKLLELIFGKKVDQPTRVKQPEVVVLPVKPQPTTPTAPPPQPIVRKTPLEEKLPFNSEKTNVSQVKPRFRFQLPKFPSSLGGAASKVGSALSIAFQRNVGKYLTSGGIFAIAGGIGGGLAGGLISGGNPLAIALGAGAGGATGAATSNYLSSPEGSSFLNNIGRGNVNSRGNLPLNRSKKSWFKGGRLLLSSSLIAFLLLAFFGGFLASIGGPITPGGEAAPLTGSVGIGSIEPAPLSTLATTNTISSCKFIHQGRTYKVGSSKLNALISEVAQKTGVPAAALAGIALQETVNFTIQDQENHPAFVATNFPNAGCDPYFPTSVTGALGLMQIQPPSQVSTYGTNYDAKHSDIEGIKKGLSFLGRDYASLTKNDFCNVRTSLYLGAGVMISKNGGKPPITAEEVRSVACKYLGSCGTYSDEVKTGFENCQTTLTTPAIAAGGDICPVPNSTIQCGSQFTPINGCGHCLPGYGQPSACVYEGTRYGLDVNGKPGQAILLPSVNGAMVQWIFVRQEPGASQAIQAYAGKESGGKQYYLQLHHTQPNSGTKGGTSGQLGGNIWSGGDHTHVQIGEGDNLSNTRWLDAPLYMCKAR